ncbi:type I methionyl aminopeptidase [Candidatus Woesebacteria bacterium RIFCSPLOWO2_01_FULL_39_61]|uniref:Methionine aminopeptidase n=2 Tax=Microgenomates group TaxID=1794810 RepID=A0A0H4T5F8_9BACT|nr:methionine aminopeptidase, methionyl aminopeptidase [uncultured Microgenomates bacterium Rifle_16ft_4_minimus_37836]OGM28069.1 MAG: type I methionyl aminopeptidase [Candidatus Woesebacteria bacterium RIFCSPHIGHO2_01_FULL_39_95]OGM34057.1 MAG: type I methionyl aminopeptidase [Candidatus Woesebacteria bacterium RIFCSPHIGHO2_02_FULL_39_13]OGM38315.1 MAG: type I methionyl aminopeptidase [Candidatus Woesebacteria bacterium RIFCSPHIGHO2_12_FULL_40_20]OGM67778.1 MAG: type I methionyl aminopeptidase
MINKIIPKTLEEIKIMTEGGEKLSKVKARLKKEVKEGVNAKEIDRLAEDLIIKSGGKSSFKMVKGYFWATCININQGVVHGIPGKGVIFKKGDLVSVDLGIYYKGYHTDTSFSVGLEVGYETKNFLEAGETALVNAIDAARVGNRIYDISREIETVLRKNNLSPIRALVGHGIGKKLHEDPQIPCFVSGEKSKSPEIPNNATLAIEVMYCRGKGDVALSHDGWTIVTSDGTISALFEETIAVTKNGPIILT